MFLNGRKKNKKEIRESGLTEVKSEDRNFYFLTREQALQLRPEADFSYNLFLGGSGDDEYSRMQALETFGMLHKDVTTVTFARPNLGTIIEHLKRYDGPDMPILDSVNTELFEALTYIRMYEWNFRRKVWQDVPIMGLSEESLPSFPGIVKRSQGYPTKEDAEISGMLEAYSAISKVCDGKVVVGRPCALFGRGKRKQGMETAGRLGQFHAGRLVMACDTRDHCILGSIAFEMARRRKLTWQNTEMMQGTSFQNRGGTTFLFNIIKDLHKEKSKRLNHLEICEWSNVDMMDATINDFIEQEECKFRYFVLDLSRQDSSISSELIDLFFEFARHHWFVPRGKNRKLRFGRWMNWCRQYTVHTRFALPDGQVWVKHKGNVSGSPLTTDINTYTALIGARTVFGVLCGRGEQGNIVCRVYGDNILVVVPKEGNEEWGLDDVVEFWKLIFDQKINPDESYECKFLVHRHWMEPRESVTFLSRHFMEDGAIWRPTFETLASMISPDSEDKSDSARFARAVGLMCDNPFDPESTLYLTKVLDDLERRGIHTGELLHREKVKLKYKMCENEEVSRRMSILECQALYMFTPYIRTQLGLNIREKKEVEARAFYLEFIEDERYMRDDLYNQQRLFNEWLFDWVESPFLRHGVYTDLEQGWRPEVLDYSMKEPDLVGGELLSPDIHINS